MDGDSRPRTFKVLIQDQVSNLSLRVKYG